MTFASGRTNLALPRTSLTAARDRSLMGMHTRLILAGVLLFTASLFAQSAPVQPATAPAPGPRLDREALTRMYRGELEEKFTPELAEPLCRAHESMERYFAARSSAERKETIAAIDALKLDPNILGRIVGLRMDWPALQGGGVFYFNVRVGPHPVLYFLGVPAKYDRTRAGGWPLLVKLPAAHAFIGEKRPDGDEVARIYTAWMNEELQKHPDALVLMPLLNLDELYGPSQPGMNLVYQPLLHAMSQVHVDTRRVYMLGHGMAGHATWNLALHYPTYFAAICPLAGSADDSFQRVRLPHLRNILTVTWHDVDDPYIKVNSTRTLVRALRDLKFDVEYEETKKLGHMPPQQIVDKLYDKMTARARNLYPAQVTVQSTRQETFFNRVDWVQVYQPLKTNGEQRLVFHHGSGSMTVNNASSRLDARITGPNQIAISPDNVATARLFFNDRMVDFARPLTIRIGGPTGRVLFEGLLKPSVEEMLKDQVTLGRGWRYFTAVWDYDDPQFVSATRPATTRAATSRSTTADR